MKKIVLALLFASGALAQTPSSASNAIGVWRGTSLCLVPLSACNDEVIVYRIAPMRGADSVSIDARKIVDGKEDPMGPLRCRFVLSSSEVICWIPRGIWNFTIRGDSLTGVLRLPNGTKFRDVRTARSR